MSLEEVPHERTCLEVGDGEVGSTSRAAAAVLGPAVTHSGDRAEHDLDAVATALVGDARGRSLVVRLDGRAAAAVAIRPSADRGLGARIAHRPIFGTVHVDDRNGARRIATAP